MYQAYRIQALNFAGTIPTYSISSTANLQTPRLAAALFPGKGLKQLYDEDQRGPQYSILVNLLLTY